MAFAYKRSLTVDHTQVSSTQTNFTVLVSVTDATLKSVGNSGHVQSSSGFDIRPYSDSGLTTALNFELERYNASTGEVVMWVLISSLSSSSDTVFYIGYGDSGITTDGSSTAAWDANFLGVYHLKDGTTLSVTSSTGSNNGTNHSATAAAGQIDGGAAFVSASSQYIDCGTGMNPTAITLSAWAKATSFPGSYNSPLVRNNAGDGISHSALMVKSTGKLALYINTAGGDQSYDGTGSHTLSTGTWYYLTLTYSSAAGLVGYVNGASDGTAAANGNLSTTTSTTTIGQDIRNGRFWNGSLDEARVANVARSAGWILTEYNNQNAPGSFITLGGEAGGNAQIFTAALSFVGAMGKRVPLQTETGSLSFSAIRDSWIVKITGGGTSGPGLTGAIVKQAQPQKTGALSFIGSLTHIPVIFFLLHYLSLVIS